MDYLEELDKIYKMIYKMIKFGCKIGEKLTAEVENRHFTGAAAAGGRRHPYDIGSKGARFFYSQFLAQIRLIKRFQVILILTIRCTFSV